MAANGRTGSDAKFSTGLILGLTVQLAAKQAGISERTAFRRLRDPNFQKDMRQLRRQAIDRAADSLAGAAADSVSVLRELLSNADPRVKLNAARAVLDAANRLVGDEIERRLADLERLIAEDAKP